MKATMTREEHLTKLKELLKLNATEIHVANGKSGDHRHEQILLRQEKEFLEHEIEKLTWLDEKPVQKPSVVPINKDGGDDPDGKKELMKV